MINSITLKGKRHRRGSFILATIVMSLIPGCGVMGDSSANDPAPEVRDVDDARNVAKELSSQILDAIGLKGKTSEPGPGVSPCEEDSKHLYKIRHPWSLWGVPEQDMERSMERLKDELPKRGWKVASYGRNKSVAKNLELIAESTKFKFSVNITFMDKRRSSEETAARAGKTSGIVVTLVSACFRVPEGKIVDQY
ncbi:hypothetical protein AB8O64_14015 [Streptomyces sp. QH1-20]|uniref:hypothetical protein n=1 Tax=Streptomyces sp. QH1-20 TaxID=3240934 RepID=UPI0035141A46